jgi:uncharacterized repeat protein (TIGR01451 family)
MRTANCVRRRFRSTQAFRVFLPLAGAALLFALLLPPTARAAGSFVEPEALPLVLIGNSDGIVGIAQADFNADAIVDVAVAGRGRVAALDPAQSHDFVAIMLGNGDGTFQGPVYIDLGPEGTARPAGLAVGDVDEDGVRDLVVAASAPRQLLVYLGRGDGTFVAGATVDAGTVALADVRAVDLDADGHLDLVATSLFVVATENQVAVLLGDGHGQFATPTLHSVGTLPHDLAIADVDGKNGPDILVVSFTDAKLYVLVNDGHGGFPATGTSFSVRTQPTGLYVADFDGDGELDALVSGREGTYVDVCGIGCVVLLHGNGDGTFVAPPPENVFRVEGWPQRGLGDAVAPDLNGDTRADAPFAHVAGFNQVTTFLSQPGGGHASAEWVASPGGGPTDAVTSYVDGNDPVSLVAGDFDADGAPDVVVVSESQQGLRPGGVSLLRGVKGKPGVLAAPRVFPSTRAWSARAADGIATGKLDADQAPDVLLVTDALDAVPGVGDGTLAASSVALPRVAGPGEFYNTLRLADLDRSGELDAIWLAVDGVQGGPPPRHLVALGHGDGTFALTLGLAPQTVGYGGRNVVATDLDGDGAPDLAVLTMAVGGVVPYVSVQLETWRNGAADPLSFVPEGAIDVQPGGVFAASRAVVAGKLDADDKPDLVAHRFNATGGDDLLLFKGNGDGTLAAGTVIASDFGAVLEELVAADLDDDGKLDLVAVGGGVWVLRGRGDGTFDPPMPYASCVAPTDARIADFDGDGNLDLALACGNGVVVLPGKDDGTFGPRRPWAIGTAGAVAVAVDDLDGDGKPDAVVGHTTAANQRYLTVLHNDSGPRADLGLALARVTDPAHAGEAVTFTLTATNRGPDVAADVTLRNPVRAGATFVSADASQGTCVHASGVVTCALGSLPASASAAVTLRLRPTDPGTLWNTASVTGSVIDPSTADNGASLATPVVAAEADLGVSMTDAPDPASVGQPVTYTIGVTNAGPSIATAVALADTLPSGATYVSAASTAGTCTHAGSGVSCDIGTLAAGSAATVTIVVTAAVAGTLSNVATASAAEPDADASNDSATAATTVTEPTPPPASGCGCGHAAPGSSALLGAALIAAICRRVRRPGGGSRRPRETR